jgi:hypothetical protein
MCTVLTAPSLLLVVVRRVTNQVLASANPSASRDHHGALAGASTIKVLLEIVGAISVEAQVQHASTTERTNCMGGELRRRDDQARSVGP